MQIVKAGYEILTPISEGGIKELQHIERIGRVCYKSEDRITEDGESAKSFVRTLIKSGHESVIEHGTLSIMFKTDRGISHEIVRHRVTSVSQSSTRYINYSKGKFGSECTFIDILPGIELDTKCSKLSPEEITQIILEWKTAMEDAEKHYMKMIELGATAQIARSVLPNSTMTELTVTANYREWRHILDLRTATAAHPQIREVMIPLLAELKQKIPVIFDDITID